MPKYKEGDIIECLVTGISSFGFFVKINDEYTGLCHISEISYDFISDIHNYVHINEIIYAQVIDIDEENKQLKLSIKDIYYKTENDGRIIESRKGFSTLKKMLPIWIGSKMAEYKEN